MNEEQEKELQKTCDALAEQFKQIAEQTKQVDCFVEKTIRNFELTVFNSMMDKLEHYTQKMIKATFITRWYWRRKIDKHLNKMDEMADLFEQLEEARKTNNNGHYND